MDARVVVAIDLGGTKASIAAVRADGHVLARVVAPAPRVDPSTAVRDFGQRARRLPGARDAVAVGLALPAIVGADGSITWAAPSVAQWQDAVARRELEAVFGVPASIEFDGYAATRGEAVFGAARGCRSAVALIVGTGFGAGVWYAGDVLRGAVGVAGAVGHMRWPGADGTLSGPAESVASGPGILAAARRRAPDARYLDTRAVFAAARRGDVAARAAIGEAASIAGAVAGAVADVVAPEIVVWTGGVGSRADFSAQATRVARTCCQPFARQRTAFVRSRLGAESSLMGAAAAAFAVAQGGSTT
jgi:glucokinase